MGIEHRRKQPLYTGIYFYASMIKDMPEAEKIKHVIRTPARLSENVF